MHEADVQPLKPWPTLDKPSSSNTQPTQGSKKNILQEETYMAQELYMAERIAYLVVTGRVGWKMAGITLCKDLFTEPFLLTYLLS